MIDTTAHLNTELVLGDTSLMSMLRGMARFSRKSRRHSHLAGQVLRTTATRGILRSESGTDAEELYPGLVGLPE